jgi:hypothetical protein
VTSDLEREVVLAQNDALRERFRTSRPEVFQKLRRCCICLRSSCGNPEPCRAEFAEWTQKKWDAAVERQLDATLGPEMVRITDTGEQTQLGRVPPSDSPALSNLTVR